MTFYIFRIALMVYSVNMPAVGLGGMGCDNWQTLDKPKERRSAR